MVAGNLTLWLVDTRSIWPGDSIKEAAADALRLLPTQDQVNVQRKHFIADARMSLASALLKRFYISRTLRLPWSDIAIARRGDPKHGKPAALLPDGSFAKIDFNVSHQGGLVTLIGWAPEEDMSTVSSTGSAPSVSVGTDITLVNERDDYRTIDAEGIDGFVDVFADVFSDGERFDMAYTVDYLTLLDGRIVPGSVMGRADRVLKRGQIVSVNVPGQDGRPSETIEFDSELITEAKLRRFYSFFAYKEAYIKLEGEALLAPWLKELEFRNVSSPRPGSPARCSTAGLWGERVDDVEVFLKGKKVKDTQMDLRAYDEGFVIASAIKGDADVRLEDYKIETINVDDMLEHARTHTR
ncbi:hypothetical protein CAC42_4006 [Sphaceloma murrayae]|uniref:holo-[acyl-carrier-protein] synthase n=1 Tax=Sphaceloma murrayae TaxID=2082308 RepID=A0A2K1QSJ2_9PEZI|nr:hypothetical protein CAC42_4006 [Sphaceloma murrayae]